ncbi:hypothetical protein [Streptomyces beijiangensis]|uniref:Uncharacterized protein n=1 Tax=Streptomyces beijiangensis TaxID=163361 RepID=A0A939JJD8_9ACTN|nr:hypothetical protein [Streptomyces beijiangensis]MBO0513544.1 hypothetical protein [Streptomyces beijiangensis]
MGSEIVAATDGGHAASNWLRLGRDGRLTAYASCADGLVRWTESSPGSDHWQGPELLPVEDWHGRFTLSQDSDGFISFAGMRHREGMPGGLEFIVATQYQTARPLSAWRPVGNPFRTNEPTLSGLGDPVVLTDGAGLLHVVGARFGQGVRGRTRSTDGAWGKWTDLDGKWVRGSVVPLVTSEGYGEYLTPFRGGAVYVRQERPGAAFKWRGRVHADAVEGTYSSYETSPGIGTYFWRHPADGSVVAYRPRSAAGQASALMPLGGAGGVGPVGIVRTPVNGYDCTVMLQLGAEGYPEIGAYPTEGEQYGAWWAPVGDRCVGLPAMGIDGLGAVTIAIVDMDGGLRVARRDLSEVGLAFGAWRRVG